VNDEGEAAEGNGRKSKKFGGVPRKRGLVGVGRGYMYTKRGI
jgi:hypothetical protein